MKLQRTFAVTKRVFRDIKNDKRTIGLMLVAPIFAMFVFGLAFSGDVENVNVIIVNHDQGFQMSNGENVSFSDKIIFNLDKKVLNIEYMDDENKALQKVKDGKTYAVIVFLKTSPGTLTWGLKTLNQHLQSLTHLPHSSTPHHS